MKTLVMSDGHGNLEFVERCISHSEKDVKIDHRVYLGDSVGYGLQGLEVVDLLLKKGFIHLMGNHEAMLLGIIPVDHLADEIYQLSKIKNKLNRDYINLLHSFLPFHTIKIDNRNILFVHGNPYNPLLGYQYEDTISNLYNLQMYDAVFMGHTHRPFVKKHNNILYVNVGSCGLPRDIGNMPSYALYDSEKNDCVIKRVLIEKSIIEENYQEVHEKVRECMLRNNERTTK